MKSYLAIMVLFVLSLGLSEARSQTVTYNSSSVTFVTSANTSGTVTLTGNLMTFVITSGTSNGQTYGINFCQDAVGNRIINHGPSNYSGSVAISPNPLSCTLIPVTWNNSLWTASRQIVTTPNSGGGSSSSISVPSTTSVLKGNGSGGLVAASPGSDYVIPSQIQDINPATATSYGTLQLAPGQTSSVLAKVATSAAYSDLSGLPSLGSAAAQNSTAFATPAQITGLRKGNGTGVDTAAVSGTDYVLPNGSITGTASNITGTLPITQTSGTLPHNQLPALVNADIPNNGANTTGTASNITGTLPISQTSGVLSHTQLPALVSGDIPDNSANTSGLAANITGNLAHAQLPALVSNDIPNNAANTTGTAANITGTLPLSQTNGTLPHSQLPTLLSADIPNNGANTTGNAATANTATTATNLIGSQTAGYVYAAPANASGSGVWRALQTSDIPVLNQNTTGTSANITGTLPLSQTSGTLPHSQLPVLLSADIPDNAANTSANAATASNLSGTPTLPTGVSAITQTTGDNSTKLATDAFVSTALTNYVYSPGSKSANTFFAAPNGSAGVPTYRLIVANDIPTLNQSTTGNAATATTANSATSALSLSGVSALPNGVTATTQTTGDNTTKVATDAFVLANLAAQTPAATTPATTSLLKGNGSANGVVAATPGTDYATPAQVIAATPAQVSGLRYGNGTSVDTAASSSQIQTAIGSGIYQATGNYLTAITGDCTATGPGSVASTCLKTNGIAFTSAATTALGTSGTTIPLLSTANSWTSTQTFAGLTSTGINSSPIGITTPSTGVFTTFKATTISTATIAAAIGTSASPSVVAAGSAASGAFSCAVTASASTCTINDTAVTANSTIIVQPTAGANARLGVTCNTAPSTMPALIVDKSNSRIRIYY